MASNFMVREPPACGHQQRNPTLSLLTLDHIARPGIQAVSQSLAERDCVALGGPSGAGKTLLLRAIADLDPHDGELYLHEQACRKLAPPVWRQQVAYVPSESHWWADRVGAHFPAPVPELLAALGFEDTVMDWSVARLSSGERQRLALARALANQPKVLLLDEPTANLDPDNRLRVEQLIQHYCREQDAAVLWVSHDADQRQRMARRHWYMEQGYLSETGEAAP